MSVWWFETFFIFTPIPGKNDPIWLAHIFQMGWFNHQLDIVKFPQIPRLCFHSSLGELRRNIFKRHFNVGGFRGFPPWKRCSCCCFLPPKKRAPMKGGASDPFGASAPLGGAEANEPLGDAESPVSRRAQLLPQPLAARQDGEISRRGIFWEGPTFRGKQTMQIHGNLERFPLQQCMVWVRGVEKYTNFFRGWLLLLLVWVRVFCFFFWGGGGKYSLSFIHYTCHSGFHFTQTSQGKTLKDGRIHGILLHHIRFKSVLGGILFGGSISKSSPCHNKLTTPPGFSPPALLSLGLKNQKKPTGLDGVGFFPKAQNVWQKQKGRWSHLGGGFKKFWFFHLSLGEMMQFDSFNIFFGWVENKTNYALRMLCLAGVVSLCAWHCFVSSVPCAPYTFLGRNSA